MKVGFVGLGNMGSGMAANLLRAGHEVTVYNRSPEKTRSLAEKGAKVAGSLAEVCEGAVVFTMLSDDPAVEQVVFGQGGVLRNLAPGAVHVSSSTVSPALTDRLADAHEQAKQGFVAAPMFGLPAAAAAGQLTVIAAGAPGVIDQVRPLLGAIGQKVVIASSKPSDALIVKLSGNFLIASEVEGLGEALALADRSGLDRNAFLNVLTSTIFTAPLYETYGRKIANRSFEPAGFPVALAEKDLRLLLAAGESLRVPTPLAALLRDRFLTLLAHGGDRLDWAAVGFLAARDAGDRKAP